MVRSNPKKQIGFLANERRMNVAVTRAKRQCILICDSSTVNNNKFLKGLTTYFKENGLSRSSFDYQGNPHIRMNYGEKVSKDVSKPKASDEKPEDAQKKGMSIAERKRDKKKK